MPPPTALAALSAGCWTARAAAGFYTGMCESAAARAAFGVRVAVVVVVTALLSLWRGPVHGLSAARVPLPLGGHGVTVSLSKSDTAICGRAFVH